MEQLLHNLATLLLQSVPTIILLLFVHFYLKGMFFRPIESVLKKRREATEGAREAGQASLARAAEKAAMYEIALKEARAEMYREQDETHRHWSEHQASRIEEARQRMHALLQQASKEIEASTAEARRSLASSSQVLALQIVEALSARRAQ